MDLGTLRLIRRALSAAVAIIGMGLVMLELRAPAGAGVSGFVVMLTLVVVLVTVWRKELAANEAAFAERERAQLAMLRVQAELAKKKQQEQK